MSPLFLLCTWIFTFIRMPCEQRKQCGSWLGMPRVMEKMKVSWHFFIPNSSTRTISFPVYHMKLLLENDWIFTLSDLGDRLETLSLSLSISATTTLKEKREMNLDLALLYFLWRLYYQSQSTF